MRLVAHISDLHFGTEDLRLAEGLIVDLLHQRPNLVVVSGDLTQRARRAQFRAAQAYLSRIPFPRLVVPGNHDVPLYDVLRRFLAPLTRYRKFIEPNLAPWSEDEEVAVLGINTARSFTWKSGRISPEQIDEIERRMAPITDAKFKILVTHHPFIPPPGEQAAAVDLVGRASQALTVIDRCRVDLLLAGHLHHGYTGEIRTFYPATKESIIVAQAGTAISRRIRSEPNAYNLITLDGQRLSISIRAWERNEFVSTTTVQYEAVGGEWRLTAPI